MAGVSGKQRFDLTKWIYKNKKKKRWGTRAMEAALVRH